MLVTHLCAMVPNVVLLMVVVLLAMVLLVVMVLVFLAHVHVHVTLMSSVHQHVWPLLVALIVKSVRVVIRRLGHR